ncbi:PEP/pyruvate-binding domain-containing protein [Oerskovia sp. M15]
MIVPLVDAVPETCGARRRTRCAAACGPAGARRLRGAVRRVPHRLPPVAPGLLAALGRGLASLGDPPVAVRSSAADEDTAAASAAGQHESVLAVDGVDGVTDAVRTCWASLHSPRATDYRSGAVRDRPTVDPVMAVLVQRLVDAEVSGVMFTPAARTT